ncbi:hypothetical protein IM156_11920 [Staphylococcus epidermidis]|nr:hypothetical protein [Staphylococcus epidermidis]
MSLSEVKAIKKVFGDAFKSLKVRSTKSMAGRSFGSTGAILIHSILLKQSNPNR